MDFLSKLSWGWQLDGILEIIVGLAIHDSVELRQLDGILQIIVGLAIDDRGFMWGWRRFGHCRLDF